MNIAVVLGYRLHDDGTMDDILVKRLELAYHLLNDEKIDLMILSGGVANKFANKSEASVMYDYLIKKNIKKEQLIKEEMSLTTEENAINSVKIAKEYNLNKLVICSSLEHFTDYDTINYFTKELASLNIVFEIYTSNKRSME